MWISSCRLVRRSERKASDFVGSFSSQLPNNLRETIVKWKNLFWCMVPARYGEIVLLLGKIFMVDSRERKGEGEDEYE